MENQILVKHGNELLRLRVKQKASEAATEGVLMDKSVKNFAKFTGKDLCQTLAQLFPCEFCEIVKNSFFLLKTSGQQLLKFCNNLCFLKSTAFLKKFTTENIKISIDNQILI